MSAEQVYHPRINFQDVNVGDELIFWNRDSGFGGSGDYIERTGVVVAKTDKTVKVKVPYGTAVLRQAAWYDRVVRRSKTAEAAPRVSLNQTIEIGGHLYLVTGGSPSPQLAHLRPVQPIDQAAHQFCGPDCTARGY